MASRESDMTLEELRLRMAPINSNAQHVRLVQPELNGGVTTIEQIAALDDTPGADLLTISGLNQESLEFLARRYPHRFQAIAFWKCPRIADLAPVGDLASVTHLSFYWNQRATRLWDLRRNSLLRGLAFDDFSKLKDLSDLATAVGLQELEFGNIIWNKAQFDSLAPLAGLTRLQSLRFNAKVIGDGDIAPLATLSGLRAMSFPPPLFERAQLAWLRARLGPGVASEVLQSHRPLPAFAGKMGRVKDIQLCGRGQRCLDARLDADKIAAHVVGFDALVAGFSANPGELAPVAIK